MGRGVGLLSLFDYKEHGVVDAIVPTKIRRGLPVRPITAVRQPPAGLGSPDLHFLRCPLPAPDGPCVLTRPLGEDGINNNNNKNSILLTDFGMLLGGGGGPTSKGGSSGEICLARKNPKGD